MGRSKIHQESEDMPDFMTNIVLYGLKSFVEYGIVKGTLTVEEVDEQIDLFIQDLVDLEMYEYCQIIVDQHGIMKEENKK